MHQTFKPLRFISLAPFAALSLALLTHCSYLAVPPPQRSVGGSLQGLSGVVSLVNNQVDIIKVQANGTFVFGSGVRVGEAYSISVLVQPFGQTCTVSAGEGVAGSTDVTEVTVVCTAAAATTYAVGGSVTGLGVGPVVLLNNGGDSLVVQHNGSFSFATPLAAHAGYTVSIAQQPSDTTCTAVNLSGTVQAGAVASVQVHCVGAAVATYGLSGSLSGSGGQPTQLQNNGENLSLSGDGPFALQTPLVSGENYNVVVSVAPPGKVCAVSGGSGAVGSSAVTGVSILCQPGYKIGGAATGINGTVVLQNGQEQLTLTASGAFSFKGLRPAAGTYQVAVVRSLTTQACTVSSGVGTVGSQDVTTVSVACNSGYAVSGQVSGLSSGSTLVLLNNNASPLTLTGPGAFTFPGVLPDGGAYAVSIGQQPAGQACSVTAGTGSINAAVSGGATAVQVTCVSGYAVGGQLVGVGGTLQLQNRINGSTNDLLALNTDGSFYFPTPLSSGQTYAVSLGTLPAGQQCSVQNANGTVTTATVANLTVRCANTVSLTQGQAAAQVLGQSNFVLGAANRGGAVAANTLYAPVGSPFATATGLTYLPDAHNNRLVAYSGLPGTPAANASFAVGQAGSLTSGAPGTGPSSLNSPYAAASDGSLFAVADYGNNRVLVYSSAPQPNGAEQASAVLGQPSFSPTAASCSGSGLSAPAGVFVGNGNIVVADSNNHRVLFYSLPLSGSPPVPTLVLGQANLTTCTPQPVGASALFYPTDVWTDGTRVVVADSGNHRVLIWTSFPTSNGAAANLVLGQVSMAAATGASSAVAMRNPTYLASNGFQLLVSDSGNNRVLFYSSFPSVSSGAATLSLGQGDLIGSTCNAAGLGASTLCNPNGVGLVGGRVLVTDTNNHRVLEY